MAALGDYIDGSFSVPSGGDPLISVNPARDGAVVLETRCDVRQVAAACEAAAAAARPWQRLSRRERFAHLVRLRDAIGRRAGELADAIVLETGKLRSEAKAEVASLIGRFDMVWQTIEKDMDEGPLPGLPHEQLRYHPLGVVAVIGPFNYPLHLCHAHVIPALLMGNAVVIKPSEVTPLAGQRYAEAIHDAKLPPGLINVVFGRGDVGAALVAHPAVRGLCFTGSYAVGRRISEQALDRPELLLALEMGGKNTALVLDDASVRQAAHEIVVGGYLTTGQRCTATDRVLAHRLVLPALIEALRPLVASLRFGDPEDSSSFAGPLATVAGLERFEAALAAARAAGAEPLVPSQRLPGGSYLRGSLHRLPDGCHHAAGYTDVECFGPDVCIEVFDDDDEAIAVVQNSPYGFANAVFTASSDRFERIYDLTHAGILNRNRSTNLASPRLPFGGVGRSGNHRPAGSYAARNTVIAMAVQDNVLGTVAVHPMLADHLPEFDFDRLASQHAAEERAEAARSLLDEPRPLGLRLPVGGRLPASDAWLIRLYAGERVVREKKPPVFDHLRSVGPWMVSVDSEPLSVLDGMSQTATLCGGFAEDRVVRGYIEGEFGDTVTRSADVTVDDATAAAFADTLRHLVPGLPEVCFANSGAEANEKALALAQLAAPNPEARKVLAFEGGFHGRTLLALHATHSPKKREPFEIAGYQCAFAPFPVWERPADEEPAAPAGYYAAAGRGDAESLRERFTDSEEDALLAAEARSLLAVHEALSQEPHVAVIIEPMQSEGGDRYATARFFRALRLLTRHHQVPLIFDEVQTGFGLGGPFAWHTRFGLVNFRGQPDFPDAVTFAKRAQVGVVMSIWPDPEPTAAHPASLVRGRMHAEMMSTAHAAERIERAVRRRLEALAQAFPHLVMAPRVRGYAFAFDLPTADHLSAYLGQRFWRGAIVFGAGSRTVRYRLSETFLAREMELLFDTIRRSLAWLEAHPHAKPPAWEDVAQSPQPLRDRPTHRVRRVPADEALALLPAILDLEYQVYEPARRTPPAEIRESIEAPDSATHVIELGEGDAAQLVGFAIGTPLEHAAGTEGPDRDPMLGNHDTMYSVSITVAGDWQGMGFGRLLKEAQLRDAAAMRRADGTRRYRYVTGRNRVGRTASMTHLNRVFGAHVVTVLTGQYEDPEGQAIYYRIPLGPIAPDAGLAPPLAAADAIDCASGLSVPLATPPESLRAAERDGLLYGPTVNKITIMNYATPALVRALEWIGALLPELPHLYLTSSRDETVDKALRLLRWHRAGARVAIGLEGGYVGHTTAAARSISDPTVHAMGAGHFDWPRVPHPAVAGPTAMVEGVRAAVLAAGGADAVFGVFFEYVQERTGQVLDDAALRALGALRDELGVPLIAVETTTAGYRCGVAPLATRKSPVRPDLVTWWGGGQTGYIHVASRYVVSAPLTMVSTWDGDELSLVRQHHQLRAIRQLDLVGASRALDEALAGQPAFGAGAYRVLELGARVEEVHRQLAAAGLLTRLLPAGRLAIIPPLDRVAEAAERLSQVLRGRP